MARISADEFRARLEKLGGLSGADVVDPTVKTKDRFGDEVEGPNPLPKVRYRVGSRGEYVVARQHPDGTFEVIEESAGIKKGGGGGTGADATDRKPQIVNLGNGRVGVVSVDEAGKGQYTPVDTGAEPLVRRTSPTPGTNTALDDPRSMTTDTVTKTQFDADRLMESDRRQALVDLQGRADKAADQARQATLDKIASEKWTAEQAATEYNKQLDAIRLQLQADSHAITQRGQDISVRGQDISAGVSQRGQDLGYEEGMARQSTSLATAMLPNINAPGQIESFNSLMGGGPPVPTRPAGMPFDPATFPMQAAMNARAQMPGQYALPGAPPPVAPGQYRLPG